MGMDEWGLVGIRFSGGLHTRVLLYNPTTDNE